MGVFFYCFIDLFNLGGEILVRCFFLRIILIYKEIYVYIIMVILFVKFKCEMLINGNDVLCL